MATTQGSRQRVARPVIIRVPARRSDGCPAGPVLHWSLGAPLAQMDRAVVPNSMLGWVIMPIGIIITLWVLFKKIKSKSFEHYLLLAISWTLIAIIFDYRSE